MPKGRFFRLSEPKTLLALQASALQWAGTQQLGPLFSADLIGDGTVQVSVVPVADPVTFAIAAGRITVHFRSSNTGPGYHAAVVDMLDHIAKALAISWAWQASDGTGLDETGFAISRDFTVLQQVMAGFLQDLCQMAPQFEADSAQTALAFCVPAGLGQENGMVACPIGFKPLAWVDALREADPSDLQAEAQEFFIWWDRGLGPDAWTRLLRAQLWQNAEWRPAVTQNDHLVHRQIAHCRARVAAMPKDLAEALADYDQMQTAEGPPMPDGIGYRKRLVYVQIFPSWAIRLSGYARRIEHEKGTAWEHPGFWLGASALILDFKADEPGAFEWPKDCEGPVREVRDGVFARKTVRPMQVIDGGTQMAIIVSQREDWLAMLILTLSSAEEWPYDAFDSWIGSVTCPDLPATPRATRH